MASLMENMIVVLQEESKEYDALLQLSLKKTPVIVAGDLDNLQKITDEEQEVVGRINRLEKKRNEVTADIANVINKDVNTLKLRDLLPMLENRPAEQEQLRSAIEGLQDVVGRMKTVNEQNRDLIQHSLEMVEFDMNLLQSMKTAPQTANYNKGAYSMGSQIGNNMHGFDAKQ